MSESVARVVPAASGIGRVVAVERASSGWRVIVADTDDAHVRAVEEPGTGPAFVRCAMGDPDQVSAVTTDVSERSERLGTPVDNAGLSRPALSGGLYRADRLAKAVDGSVAARIDPKGPHSLRDRGTAPVR